MALLKHALILLQQKGSLWFFICHWIGGIQFRYGVGNTPKAQEIRLSF